MPTIPPEILDHYAAGIEQGRLAPGSGDLERTRVQDILARRLPPPPATILDVGGASGVHALWLADRGYDVHLVDPVELHVTQARAASEARERPLASVTQGDARGLPFADGSADVVLLFGPLYHLLDRADRISALREARRALRPGGLVFAATVSRFASLLDGLRHNHIADPAFRDIVSCDLRNGHHRNPNGHPAWFTTAHFHHPDELRSEMAEAGFTVERLIGTEGPAWLSPYFGETWTDPERRAWLLDTLRAIEEDPAIVGASAHPIGVGRVRRRS